MRASRWEFKNRAVLFGVLFGASFSLYAIDPQNSAAALANTLSTKLSANTAVVARTLFTVATLLLALAALIRTWASSYLRSSIVYAGALKTEALVADGPYRYVRNPLYAANVLLAVGLGAMMSRAGMFVALALMVLFCYRLIIREESELLASQGERYSRYLTAVPRMWPALAPRLPSAGQPPQWTEAFKSEFWCWGFALSVAAFTITLSVPAFFIILGTSVLVLWLSASVIKPGSSQAADSQSH